MAHTCTYYGLSVSVAYPLYTTRGGNAWDAYTDGFNIDMRPYSGHLAVLVTNGAARQSIVFDAPYPSTLNLSGCSQPLAVTGASTRYLLVAVYHVEALPHVVGG